MTPIDNRTAMSALNAVRGRTISWCLDPKTAEPIIVVNGKRSRAIDTIVFQHGINEVWNWLQEAGGPCHHCIDAIADKLM